MHAGWPSFFFLSFSSSVSTVVMETRRKIMKNLTLPVLFAVCVAASMIIPQKVGAEFVHTMEIGLHSGFRLDQLDWNIAGYNTAGQYINVLSELDWEDLDIWQLGATGKLSMGNSTAAYRTYVRGSVDYGWITDGTSRDSDYDGNNRTMEIFRSISVTEDDNVFDGVLGLGIEKDLWHDSSTIGLLGGYSYHEQNLRFTNGVLVIPHNMPFEGLNSTYKTKWQGPFAGIDLELRPSPHFSLFGSVEYHWPDYEGEADWNLRSDLAHPVSFRHEADNGDGLVLTLRGNYLFSNQWSLDLAWVYCDFSASDGIDMTFMASGASFATKFNEVNWQSSAVNLALSYRF
jgi:hypothetical protein